MSRLAVAVAVAMAGVLAPSALPMLGARAQVLPDGVTEVPFECASPSRARPQTRPEPASDADRLEVDRRSRYRTVFPAYLSVVPPEPSPTLLMPIPQVSVGSVANTWGGQRDGGRVHEGQDIFAPMGTAILAAAPGYVYRVGLNPRGGNVVVIVAAGGRRHYYAHLERFGEIREGQAVDVDTVIGFVGTSGNAVGTPPHLHFAVYDGPAGSCEWDAIDPLPMLVDRLP
jgi:murein DD-endopeptidase MepM/ murein hydrolase activator NlpD